MAHDVSLSLDGSLETNLESVMDEYSCWTDGMLRQHLDEKDLVDDADDVKSAEQRDVKPEQIDAMAPPVEQVPGIGGPEPAASAIRNPAPAASEIMIVAVDASGIGGPEPVASEMMIAAVDASGIGGPEPPSKRRRVRGKQMGQEARARGLELLIPRPLRLPLVMAAIISAMMNIWPVALDDPLDAVEVFSGVKSTVYGFHTLGMKAVGFDKCDDDRQDITKPWGMLDLTHKIRRVKVGGLLPWATPCSTWVTVNRGTSQRTLHNPRGHFFYESVSEANVTVARMALLMIWSVILGLQWLLEQPQSSLMPEEPWLRSFLR